MQHTCGPIPCLSRAQTLTISSLVIPIPPPLPRLAFASGTRPWADVDGRLTDAALSAAEPVHLDSLARIDMHDLILMHGALDAVRRGFS